MNIQDLELPPMLPDLRDLSLERLAELDDCVLANSIALYLERFDETDLQPTSFNARI